VLTKLTVSEELSPGERISCRELMDHLIFGCVEDVDAD